MEDELTMVVLARATYRKTVETGTDQTTGNEILVVQTIGNKTKSACTLTTTSYGANGLFLTTTFDVRELGMKKTTLMSTTLETDQTR